MATASVLAAMENCVILRPCSGIEFAEQLTSAYFSSCFRHLRTNIVAIKVLTAVYERFAGSYSWQRNSAVEAK